VKRVLAVILCLASVAGGAFGGDRAAGGARGEVFSWDTLPDLPGPLGKYARTGLSGAFVGIAGDVLIVAGGGHFPDRRPWSAPEAARGVKIWPEIYVLTKDAGGDAARGADGKEVGAVKYKWHTGSSLPWPRAYGAAVSTKHGLVCIGGRDADMSCGDVFLLTWDGGKRKVVVKVLPSLPRPRAFAGAAVLGSKVYVACGIEELGEPTARRTIWSLDLSKMAQKGAFVWDRKLPAFGGGGRISPAMAAQSDGSKTLLYVMGGQPVGLVGAGAFKDAWCFDPGKYNPGADTDDARAENARAWKKLTAAPWMPPGAGGVAIGQSHVAVFGDTSAGPGGGAGPADWEGPAQPVLLYHTITDRWTTAAGPAGGYVPSAVVKWGKAVVVPSLSDRRGMNPPRIFHGRLKKPSGGFGFWNWAALVVYLLAMVAMGVYFSRRGKTTDDFFLAGHFFLAGRRIPWWAAGLSIFGTALSAITFMTFPAKAFKTNWVYSLNSVVPILLVPVVIAFYIPFYRRLKITTAYEYLEKRFNLAVRLFGSAAFVLFQLGRMTFVLYLPALALSTVTGFNVYVCIVLMGVLCTVYTVLGGIEAVIWTDVLQVVILMSAAVVSLVVISLGVEGGFGAVVRTAMADGKLHTFNLTWDYTAAALWVIVVGNLFGALMPLTADQTVVQRYLCTRDEKSAGRALWMSTLGGIPIVIVFYGLGAALYAFYKSHPGGLSPAIGSDAIYPLFIVQQMPPGVSGLVIAGIFAAGMSSLDSSMNSISTAVVTDYYRRFRPDAPDGRCLRLARGIVVVLGVLAVGAASVVARMELKDILDAYMTVFGLFGGGLAGLFALAIFTRRAHGTGALVGVLASAAMLYFVKSHTPMHYLLYPVVGVVTCFVVGYVASLVLPAGQKEKDLGGLTVHTIDRGRP